jgi:flagellar hook-associated protein 1 FlgK
MRPTFLGFEASKSSLFASQKAMDITGHNLSNIYSDGYTRQRINQVALAAGEYPERHARNLTELQGLGTRVNGVQQIRDKKLDMAFRKEYANTGYYDTKAAILGDIQGVLQELASDSEFKDMGGIRAVMSNLFAALEDFSAPGKANSPANANVVANAFKAVTQTVNNYAVRLEDSANQFKWDLSDKMNEFNVTLAKIAELNKKIENSVIANNYGGQYGPNELLDERNLLLDDLSRFGQLGTEELKNGMIKVTMNGHTIVDGFEFYDRVNYQEMNNGTVQLRWRSNGEIVDMAEGATKGYTEMLNGRGVNMRNSYESQANGYLYYKDMLDSFADKLAELANATIPEYDSTTGKPLVNPFTGDIVYKQLLGAAQSVPYNDPLNGISGTRTEVSGTLPVTAMNITVSDDLLNDSTYLIYDMNSDDNTYILSMIQKLEYDRHPFGPGGGNFSGTFMDFITGYQATIGNETRFNEVRAEASIMVLGEIMTSRDSVSGVNESEETANMLTHNRVFQAASRMITTMDELLDVIINKMGLY